MPVHPLRQAFPALTPSPSCDQKSQGFLFISPQGQADGIVQAAGNK
jgi:hypothetical protein